MALATDLPIYSEAYELLVLVTRLTQQYPRGYRQGLARDISSTAQETVNLVFRANCAKEKYPILERLKAELQCLQLQLRLSKDLRLISASQFAATVVHTDNIGKQLTGWAKYYAKLA
ncbi:MAG: four helix bundle protein [Methylococcaceae bacterium]